MLKAAAGPDADRLFSSFELGSRRTIVAAVSGGSDSTALLLLLRDFLEERLPGTRPIAVTVDHGLRAGSTAEAEAVAQHCAELGVVHRTVRWTGSKPATGLPAAARVARYRLLAEAALDAGSDIVLTGHTADDQAETILMRAQRGDGRGLSGMAPITLFEGRTWIGRPLLACGRDALRRYLADRRVGWSEDPSNADTRFERSRMRLGLRGDGEIAAALRLAHDAGQERERLGEEAAALIGRHAACVAPGLYRLDPHFADHPARASVYALRLLLATVGGRSFLPDARRAEALLLRLQGGGPLRAVLCRTLLDSRRAGILLLREARGLPAPGWMEPGQVWDGRFRLAGKTAIRASAHDANVGLDEHTAHGGVPQSVVYVARSSEPLATDAAGDRAHPVPVAAPFADFLPSFDLEPARALAALIGAEEPPTPPLREHIGP